MLEAPRELIHNKAYNIGLNSENYQVRQLADIVKDTVPNCTIEYADKGGPDPRNYRVDFTRLAKTFPNLKLQWNAGRGAQELYNAFKKVGLTLADLQGRKYIRLNQLKHLLAADKLDETLRWK